MSRDRASAERVLAVRRVLEAGRALQTRGGPWIDDLARATGLSRAGVLRGLAEHLEVDAPDDEIAKLVEAAGDAPCVHVILSANVFVGALRAIALAVAAAPRVVVRPSSREPIFASALVEALADPAVTLAAEVDVATIDEGEIHLYGSDRTIDEVRARVRPGVRLRAHGAGMGLAIVPPEARLADAARDLAADVAPFDQRGCLSPRIAFVLGDADRAHDFLVELDRALAEEERTTPRGELDAGEIAEARRYVETVRFAGEVIERPRHAVGCSRRLVVPPPGRHVHVIPVLSLEVLRAHLDPVVSAITSIGIASAAPEVDSRADPIAATLDTPRARVAHVGRMQRPPLDGPVDRR